MALSCLLFTDRHTDAVNVLEAMARSARRTGSPHAYAWYSTMCARHEHVRGEPPAAAESARTALDLFPETLTLATEMALAFLVFALVEQGELEQAQDALARYGADSGRFSQTTSGFTLLLARSALRLGQGRISTLPRTPKRSSSASESEAAHSRAADSGGSRSSRCTQRGKTSVPFASRRQTSPRLGVSACAAPRGSRWRCWASCREARKGRDTLRERQRSSRTSPRRLDRAHALIELGRRSAAPAVAPTRASRSVRAWNSHTGSARPARRSALAKSSWRSARAREGSC